MPVDLKIAPTTHDFQFSGTVDLSTVDGNDLVNQRILTRLSIQKGSFIYDPTGTLGSSLTTAFSQPTTDDQITATEQLIREALQPMDDIQIVNVFVESVQQDPLSQKISLQALVQWVPVSVGSGNSTPLTLDPNSVPISF